CRRVQNATEESRSADIRRPLARRRRPASRITDGCDGDRGPAAQVAARHARPVPEQNAFPAVDQAAAVDTDAGGVLQREIRALIADPGAASLFRREVLPVLRDAAGIVDGFIQRVADHRPEPGTHAARQTEIQLFVRAVAVGGLVY